MPNVILIIMGKPHRISRYAKTKEEAVKILNELTFLYDTKPRTFEKCTLEQWLRLCLEVYLCPGIKQSTYLSYEFYIRNHLGPVLGEVQQKDITPRMLQMFYNHKQAVEGLSPKTIININLFLHRVLDFAVSEGLLNANPAYLRIPGHGAEDGCQDPVRDPGSRFGVLHVGYLYPCPDRA